MEETQHFFAVALLGSNPPLPLSVTAPLLTSFLVFILCVLQVQPA
jgi:hypothetical protein